MKRIARPVFFSGLLMICSGCQDFSIADFMALCEPRMVVCTPTTNAPVETQNPFHSFTTERISRFSKDFSVDYITYGPGLCMFSDQFNLNFSGERVVLNLKRRGKWVQISRNVREDDYEIIKPLLLSDRGFDDQNSFPFFPSKDSQHLRNE